MLAAERNGSLGLFTSFQPSDGPVTRATTTGTCLREFVHPSHSVREPESTGKTQFSSISSLVLQAYKNARSFLKFMVVQVVDDRDFAHCCGVA
jgi:hypothetical protein